VKKFLLIAAAVCFATSAYAADKKIERAYKSKCASCHAKDGTGDTEKGKKMKIVDFTNADWQSKVKDEDMKKAITDGVKKEEGGVKKEMDAFKDDLKPEQIDGLVKLIREFKK